MLSRFEGRPFLVSYATDATGTVTSPDSIARILPSDLPAVTTLTSGVNAIADTVQTALTNNYLRKTSGNIVNADISASAAIVGTKIATGTITSTNILDGTILNADINAAAAISMTKVSAAPYCLAYRAPASGSEAFGAISNVVSFSTATDNTGSMWVGGSPSRITIPSTGWYRFMSEVSVTATGPTTDGWTVRKNGSTTLVGRPGASLIGELGAFSLTATDYVELLWTRVTATAVSTNASATVISPGTTGAPFGALLVQYLGA